MQKKYKSIENIERDFLTIEQTAEYIGKSYHHTHRLITKGNRFNKIPFTLLFGRKIVKKKDLEKFVIDKSRRLEDKNRLKDMNRMNKLQWRCNVAIAVLRIIISIVMYVV